MSEYFPVPDVYRCPLCPNHEDEEFCGDPLLTSICKACFHEIINLVTDDKPIEDSALDQLRALTGFNRPVLRKATARRTLAGDPPSEEKPGISGAVS